jgi:ribosomal RNA-processing protein 1
VQPGAGDLSGMRDADSVINVSVDDSVISNLEQKFASIAAETAQEARSNGSSGGATPTEIGGKKKRKRGKTAEVTEPSSSENTSSPGQLLGKSIGVDRTPGSNSTKKKKVKFVLKNNIVWKPNNPLPPQSMRTPPSATPRGSALKKGVPAGPIRVTPTRKVGSGSKRRSPSQILSITKQKPARSPKSLSKGPRFARRVRKSSGSL